MRLGARMYFSLSRSAPSVMCHRVLKVVWCGNRVTYCSRWYWFLSQIGWLNKALCKVDWLLAHNLTSLLPTERAIVVLLTQQPKTRHYTSKCNEYLKVSSSRKARISRKSTQKMERTHKQWFVDSNWEIFDWKMIILHCVARCYSLACWIFFVCHWISLLQRADIHGAAFISKRMFFSSFNMAIL